MDKYMRSLFPEKFRLVDRAREIARSRPLKDREVEVLLSLRQDTQPVFRSHNLFYRLRNSLSELRTRESSLSKQDRNITPDALEAMQLAGRGISRGQVIGLPDKSKTSETVPTYRPATFMEANLLYCDIHGSAPKKCIDELKQDHSDRLHRKLGLPEFRPTKQLSDEEKKKRKEEKKKREEKELQERGKALERQEANKSVDHYGSPGADAG